MANAKTANRITASPRKTTICSTQTLYSCHAIPAFNNPNCLCRHCCCGVRLRSRFRRSLSDVQGSHPRKRIFDRLRSQHFVHDEHAIYHHGFLDNSYFESPSESSSDLSCFQSGLTSLHSVMTSTTQEVFGDTFPALATEDYS